MSQLADITIVHEDEMHRLGRRISEEYLPIYAKIAELKLHEVVKLTHTDKRILTRLMQSCSASFPKKNLLVNKFYVRQKLVRRDGGFALYIERCTE